MKFVFSERKAAQAAACLIRLGGGRMDYGRLIKLLYLADRQSLIGSGAPITGDRMVSLDYGPVLSKILDMSQVTSSGELAEWHEYIKDEPQPRFLSVANDNRNTDELSEFELAVLGDVHQRLRHKLQHIGHHADICIQLTHGLLGLYARELVKLEYGQTQGLCGSTEGIRFFTGFFGFAKDPGNCVATGHKSL